MDTAQDVRAGSALDGDHDALADRARVFRDRHTGGPVPLVRPNAWDCAEALVYESMGSRRLGRPAPASRRLPTSSGWWPPSTAR